MQRLVVSKFVALHVTGGLLLLTTALASRWVKITCSTSWASASSDVEVERR